jgi:hypothetical protein
MSYVDRMCFRMMAGCLVPLAAAIPVAYVIDTLLGLPAALGGPANLSDVPFFVGMTGAGLSLLLFAIQGVRLWRWRLGKADDCFVCGCLLGQERNGRWGPYRKCLGCGKSHSARAG